MQNIIDGNLTKLSFVVDNESYVIVALYRLRNDYVDFFKLYFPTAISKTMTTSIMCGTGT